MIYLERFRIPSLDAREQFTNDVKRRCYNTVYPFNVFELTELPELTFEPVTILCGGNGSGKSTLLNVMAEKLSIPHGTAYNRSHFFEDYLRLCRAETCRFDPEVRRRSRIITSDDVFDYLLNIRALNEGLSAKRQELLQEYSEMRRSSFQMKSLADYEELKKHLEATRRSGSQYVRRNMMDEAEERSNGESALQFFTQSIGEGGLYLLDEPENSLSASRQMELAEFLAQSARFFGCQLVISTHSPFLLAIPEAKIYDLDGKPPRARRWTELENVRLYRDFFRRHEDAFRE